MKKKMDDNSGYTLVELIIVMAIIVILTTAAMVTMSVMRTAKVKEAAATFDAEVTDLIARTRNQNVYQDANNNGVMDAGEELDGYKYELAIFPNGDKYYVSNYYLLPVGTHSEVSAAKRKNLSAYVTVQYSDFDGIYNNATITNTHTIRFDKSGACVDGAGVYKFLKKNGSVIATVTINKNGSHQIK
ncbi:MAG: type II secretion system GspH family protein [Clostridium sp.]|nr:type II secretion system GspH family protein [Clostridium sp.]MCM1209711.1 type II secretion system GspH family protein [Ruminococcus sp.]